MLALHRGRRLILPSFVALALVAITCRSTAYFDLDHEGHADLTQGSSPQSISFVELSGINLAAHPLMKTQGLDGPDVTSAKLTRASLLVQTPATGVDLSFLSQVNLVLNADGMAPLTVATGANFAPHTNLVPLTLQASEIVGYLKGKNPSYTLAPTFVGPVPGNLTLSIELVTQVRVGEPGGSCQN